MKKLTYHQTNVLELIKEGGCLGLRQDDICRICKLSIKKCINLILDLKEKGLVYGECRNFDRGVEYKLTVAGKKYLKAI